MTMPATVVRQLKEHRRLQLLEQESVRTEKQPHWDLVFTRSDGRPLEGTTVSRHFHAVLDRAGLTQRRFHDLRHSCATLLLVQGVSPRVVMEILGHSEIGMTMNTYSHVVPELRRDTAARMDDVIRERGR